MYICVYKNPQQNTTEYQIESGKIKGLSITSKWVYTRNAGVLHLKKNIMELDNGGDFTTLRIH